MSHRSSAEIRELLRTSGRLPEEWFRRDNRYGLAVTARVVLPFLVLLATLPIVSAELGIVGVAVSGFLIGTLAYQISIVTHDCCHASLFEKPYWNQVIGHAGGCVTGSNFPTFKHTHNLHHRYNLSEKDPQFHETAGLDGASRRQLVWHLTKALFGFRVLEYAGDYLGFSRDDETSADAGADGPVPKPPLSWLLWVIVTQVGIATLATGFGSEPALALVYPVAAVTVSLFLGRLRTVAEHIQADGDDLPDFARSHRPSLPDRTFLYVANFNYHLEHHVYPNIPSCHLWKLHERLRDTVHTPKTLGTSMFSTLFARLRECPR